MRVWTHGRIERPKIAAKPHSDQQITPPDDDLDIPNNLRRCDHCGQPGTAANPLHPWDWPGRPDGISLHTKCEEAWFTREAGTTKVAKVATSHNPHSPQSPIDDAVRPSTHVRLR